MEAAFVLTDATFPQNEMLQGSYKPRHQGKPIKMEYGAITGTNKVDSTIILDVVFEFPYSEDAYCTATYPESRP